MCTSFHWTRELSLTLRGTPGDHVLLLPVVPEQSTKYLLTVSRWMFPSLLEGGNQCHRWVGLCLPKGGDHTSEMRQSKRAVHHLKCCSVWIRKCRRGVLKTETAEYTRSTFMRIAGKYDMIVDAMEALKDHVYVFLKPPLGFLPLASRRFSRANQPRRSVDSLPEYRSCGAGSYGVMFTLYEWSGS